MTWIPTLTALRCQETGFAHLAATGSKTGLDISEFQRSKMSVSVVSAILLRGVSEVGHARREASQATLFSLDPLNQISIVMKMVVHLSLDGSPVMPKQAIPRRGEQMSIAVEALQSPIPSPIDSQPRLPLHRLSLGNGNNPKL